jgi:nitroreductase
VTFEEVVRRQRACRTFLPDPVAEAVLVRVLEAATFAPSAENRQPWVLVVVTDATVRARVAELARRAWDGGGRAHSEGRLPPGLLADVDHGVRAGLAGAPVHVVVAVDTSRVAPGAAAASIWPAVQNLLLAATAAGLGSALTTLAAADPSALRAVVGLPEEVRPVAVVPLGRPARRLSPPRRRPLAEVAHRERWGRPFP